MKRLWMQGYGLCCWVEFLPLELFTLGLAMPLPRVDWRRRVARRGARLFFTISGLEFQVEGLHRLPPGHCVVVANHASYLDGVILHAALPPRFAFVIKREMVRVPVASLLLRLLGSEFVERHDRKRGGADARRVVSSARAGQSLAVFPEGTFTAEPGLGPFQSGAFLAAARTGATVVPAVIRGARDALPDGRALPRRARITVEILEPLPPTASSDRSTVHALRDHARRAILERLGEPDRGLIRERKQT